MMLLPLILAALFHAHSITGAVYDNGQKPVILPQLPARSKICKFDAFMASTSYNGKVFLFPWETSDRTGNWMKNYGFCAAHCAEMVTISSLAENEFFLDFMRSAVFAGANQAIWLGAQVYNQTFSGWTNGQANTYDNRKTSTEYNEDGLTCLTAGYGITNDLWYNYYCNWDNYFVACQRGSSWTPNIAPPCYNDNDLIILLDSSGSIGSGNYVKAKAFVNELARAYAAQSGSRVAVYLFSNTVVQVFGLTNTLSADAMSSAILGATYINSNTDTALGIDATVTEFLANPRVVPVPKNLVVITDGQSNVPIDTVIAANNAISNNIQTYSIGVGSNVDDQELLDIADDNLDNVFNAASFDLLVNLLNPVSQTICSNSS